MESNKEFPSVFGQAKNLLKLTYDTMMSKINDPSEPIISDGELRDQRVNICHSCEYFSAPHDRCKLCGCAIELKVKLRSARCPDQKW